MFGKPSDVLQLQTGICLQLSCDHRETDPRETWTGSRVAGRITAPTMHYGIVRAETIGREIQTAVETHGAVEVLTTQRVRWTGTELEWFGLLVLADGSVVNLDGTPAS